MPKPLFLVALLLCFGAASSPLRAQDCAPPPITVDSNIYNIFSPEQEMIFGELTYQQMSGDMRFIRDAELEGYLRQIGAKLVQHLPPTGLKFQFFIVDLPDANAFNIPGGYVFVSRKLIGFTNSEDELAGVVAHELGHATVRHAASDVSELLKKILNVKQLGDRKDVIEKYNLLIERERTKRVSQSRSHEDGQQLQADRIGLFALVAAGYDATAFGDFFSRLVDEKAPSGNWFTNIFGKLNPEEKRLREMIKATEKMPAQCRAGRSATATDSFLRWQANVVSYRENRKEELAGLLWKKELAPKLRSDISHFAFSPDGKYLLAQDDFAISVLQREPLQVLFQIPAPESHEAAFTPDGQFVVVGSKNMRYEKWSVAEKKPVAIRELVVAKDCIEHQFSPDGNYLACVDYSLGLNLLDTQTGKRLWQKKKAFTLNFLEYLGWVLRDPPEEGLRFFNMEYSPDSHFFAIARSASFRFRFSFDMYVDATEDTMLAVDLTTLKEVGLGGDLKKLARRSFLFLDPNRILAMANRKVEEGGIFSFPAGKRLDKLPISALTLERTANDNFVVIKPLANAKLGVYDLTRKAIVHGTNVIDATVWNNLMVHESINGKVVLSEFHYDEALKRLQGKEVGTIEIPVGSLGTLQAAELSDNMQWLAVSSKTRGAVWNIGTGERKMYLRGFRGALLADSGNGIGDFPKFGEVNHSLVVMATAKSEASTLREIPEKGARQYRRFLFSRTSLKAQEKKETEKDAKGRKADEDSEDAPSLAENVRFELFDLVGNKSVWTADYPKEAPRFFFDEFSGRLILYWRLDNDRAKQRLKESPELAARAKELGDKADDYLVEIIDAYAGKAAGTLLLETGKGSFSVDDGFSEGDWLVLRDSENRVLAYSIKDGTLRNRFFGSYAAINPTKNQIVVENYPGELTFYDLATGDSQARLVFPGDTAFVRFSLDGKKLFVLSGQQTAYLFDLEKLPAQPVAAREGD